MSAAQPPAAQLSGEGYELTLTGGATHTLLAGASLGLVGAPAVGVLHALAAATGAALLLPDHTQPLHAGITVGEQIAAALGGTRRAALDRATDLLELTGVPEPHDRARARPHQLGRLDRQRAQLALALAAGPAVIAAEDPAAELDQPEVAAFATLLSRLRSTLGVTLVVAALAPEAVEGLVEEIIVLGGNGIVQRRRRRAPQASSSSSSST